METEKDPKNFMHIGNANEKDKGEETLVNYKGAKKRFSLKQKIILLGVIIIIIVSAISTVVVSNIIISSNRDQQKATEQRTTNEKNASDSGSKKWVTESFEPEM